MNTITVPVISMAAGIRRTTNGGKNKFFTKSKEINVG